MSKYTPSEYAEQIEEGAVCDRTIRNWIKTGKIPGEGERVKKTRTGRWIIFVDAPATSSVEAQFAEIMAERMGC